MKWTLGGIALAESGSWPARGADSRPSSLVSPGCRGTKVKVARLYVGVPQAHYPNPDIDFQAEIRAYEDRFRAMSKELADIDWSVHATLSKAEDIAACKDRLLEADGILLVHVTLHTMGIIRGILELKRPTMIFSPPYAGHEWYELAQIRRQPLGAQMDCILSTDYQGLAAAVRPFRAMHHLREARILNLTTRGFEAYAKQVKARFGAEIRKVPLERVLALYESIRDADARAETDWWIENAEKVVEPKRDEIAASCRLALAFEKLLDEEDATALTVDCYGTMWRKIPAYPCIGFTRLNDMGLGGICQSDLPCAIMHVLYQGLSGRPGFVCNPTFDFASNTAILIHCLGTRKMDGPAGPAHPYELRSVMERREGVVPQVRMSAGRRVTAGILDDASITLRYFTGLIADAPHTERGCRSQIAVRLDGRAEKLWRNWASGIHRVACYEDVTRELEWFCRFKGIELLNEAV
ncbi:MAG TPA: hypothetical protein P5555_12780 [Candidatus Paceibacterota bacterium]|nr:hypothetical protein [Verrucomicrobiota bacterium]HOX03159.1 hypothetical protein [Verrucomicrobiota bacterium]HRZ46057.1 hypothetical protein [Candidatus Paceibacterota bacterium]HRZ94636.1 hypothetical protein [Candidatus Paceibacterota bacterium]